MGDVFDVGEVRARTGDAGEVLAIVGDRSGVDGAETFFEKREISRLISIQRAPPSEIAPESSCVRKKREDTE
jgi:hypothetical protein